ncbi:MAG: UDP-N-acetylmuramate--L-alanine ligase [Bacteroidales bacterium]|nr:UDP-N-acetylmuramate--L-alanine ligase [Bacteroidales bacterium]
MKPEQIHRVYFIGIGGIGMSALARYFKSAGKHVAGYDRTPTQLTEELSGSGIDIHYEDDIRAVPEEFLAPDETLIVITPAIPDTHSELQYFRSKRFHIHKRAEILGMLSMDKRAVCVAGTHGKTTVATMIAWLMHQSDFGCSAFLGGISKNFNSNYLHSDTSEYLIAEADEYDRSFLRLHPEIAVVTAIDADHLDIYGSLEEVRKSFKAFVSQIQREGKLIIKQGIELQPQNPWIEVYTYALEGPADYHAKNIRIENGRYHFDVVTPVEIIRNLSLSHPGLVNVENAIAAIAATIIAGLSREKIKKSLAGFSGIMRRFDVIYQTGKVVYVDDYAHHPKELDAIIGSVRKLYPGRKITGIFQPHLYSRTRDFAVEFAGSLDKLDELILLDIYPARELPVKNVSSDLIFRDVKLKNKILIAKGDLTETLKDRNIEVLITMGAGDIDCFREPIKQLLIKKYGG